MANFADIISDLRAHRAEAAAQVEALDRAIAELVRLNGGSPPAAENSTTRHVRRRSPKGYGVKEQVVEMITESGRDWDAHEILAEFERQGRRLNVADPLNTIRSALSRNAKAGRVIRTSAGRYGPVTMENLVTHTLSTDTGTNSDADLQRESPLVAS